MKLICPSCGAVHSVEAWVSDGQIRQCLLIVAELPEEVSRRALPYLSLFRPGSGRGLVWSKTLRLLSELNELVRAPFVDWDRKPARPNSARAWAMAMERIIERPPKQIPLTSHGYLRKVAYELADELDRANEVRHNEQERSGALRHTRPPSEPEPISREELRRIRDQAMGKYKHGGGGL